MSNVNAHRKGYKHTPLGWIPEKWEIKEFEQLGGFKGGGTPNTDIDRYWKGEIPWVSPKDMKTDIVEETQDYITDDAVKESTTNLIAEKSILIVTRSGILRSHVPIAINTRPVAINQDLKAFEPRDPKTVQFIFHYLKFRNRQLLFTASKVGTTVESLDFSALKNFQIISPPPPEQSRIATLLSCWDKAIIKTYQLIAQLQERNKGLMQQLLSPKKRWKEYRIGELFKEIKRPVKWNEEELYNLISVRRRSVGAFYRESLYGKQILTKQLYTVEEGDFLISKMQIIHGASAVVPTQLSGMKVSGSYIVVHTRDSKKLDINFLNWVSKTRWFYRLTYISSYGVHIEKMTFDFEDFKRRKILIPGTIKEQKRITTILQLAADEVALYEERLSFLKEQKKGLMQKLLTGEIRVNS
ncbi:MAG TPA: restriction endonuclease subunit S [Chitinophagaceae bacterium]|nr:restriction endonuclease subunit S [Chitinophagaceae bacterium]